MASSKFDTADAVDAAGNGVAADERTSGRRSRRKVDNHTCGRVAIDNAGVAVAGDCVVTAHALKFVEGAVAAGIRAATAKARGVIDIGGIRSANRTRCSAAYRSHRPRVHTHHGQSQCPQLG